MSSESPTPQGISALLRKAGHRRSERSGRNGFSSGFAVRKDWSGADAVHVRHHFLFRGDAKPYLAKYSDAITAAGWNVEVGEYELTVTAAKEADR